MLSNHFIVISLPLTCILLSTVPTPCYTAETFFVFTSPSFPWALLWNAAHLSQAVLHPYLPSPTQTAPSHTCLHPPWPDLGWVFQIPDWFPFDVPCGKLAGTIGNGDCVTLADWGSIMAHQQWSCHNFAKFNPMGVVTPGFWMHCASEPIWGNDAPFCLFEDYKQQQKYKNFNSK